MTFLTMLLAVCTSGTFGRMGGAKGYHTLWRDWGCSAIVTLLVIVNTHAQLQFWWIYAAIFLLHWGAFSTYWQFLFHGKDTMWFSGIMVGMALLPIAFISINYLWIVAIRAAVLMVVWECLNRYLPQKVFIWKRDIVEEVTRYAVSL